MIKKGQIEILAPAGNEEMLKAAVFSGADAVYLGFAGFNARASAGNFDAETLKQAVSFCHGRGVAVHVALNTTVYTQELEALAAAITAVAKTGADALIVQDLATAALVRKIAPELSLHGSTQMSVHSLQGALQLADMGFSRVILSRELSREEIRNITQNCPIETEIFVHGALCMSVSGQCYMSAFLGGRSGNRGSCAGTCRLPFCAGRAVSGEEHHLSLKDNSLLSELKSIQNMGVVSAKIEGRLRTPEYVAAAIGAARAARDGETFDEQLLQNVFSRSGFTRAWYEGKNGRDMFGMRTAQDAAASREALPKLRELYRRELSDVPVHMKLTVEEEGAKLLAWDEQGNRVSVYGEQEPQPAHNDPTESLKKSLAKTGGTPFAAVSAEVEMIDGSWYLPGSAVNELRRKALEQLLQKRSELKPVKTFGAGLAAPQKRVRPEKQLLSGRFDSIEQIADEQWNLLDEVIVPLSEAEKVPAAQRGKTIAELPRVSFGNGEKAVWLQVERLKNAGFKGFLAQNIAHLRLAKDVPLYGGFGLNITNSLSAEEYADLGLEGITILPEVLAADMEYIYPEIPTAALAYGRMPLMITRACPLKNVTDCDRCSKKGRLVDRKQKQFPVVCGGSVRTVYNTVPIYMGDKKDALPVDTLVLYFTTEEAKEALAVTRRFIEGSYFEGEFTRGLYFRGTQSANDEVNRRLTREAKG